MPQNVLVGGPVPLAALRAQPVQGLREQEPAWATALAPTWVTGSATCSEGTEPSEAHNLEPSQEEGGNRKVAASLL